MGYAPPTTTMNEADHEKPTLVGVDRSMLVLDSKTDDRQMPCDADVQ